MNNILMNIQASERVVKDGICVFVANKFGVAPEEVEIKEIEYHKNGRFTAKARTFDGDRENLDTREIETGVAQFLEEYHCYNPSIMNIKLTFDAVTGIGANIILTDN